MSGKNPLGNGREPQSYEGINIIVPVGGWRFVKAVRNPTTSDLKYPIGSLWVNTSANSVFFLTSVASGSATWTEVDNSGGGLLPVPNGGTGATSFTSHGVLIGEGTAAVQSTAAGSAGQVLQSGGASANPLYSTATYPSTTTINQILFSSAANTVSGLATANDGALVTSSAGVPSIATSTDGQILTGSTSGTPAFATITTATGVAFTTGSASLAIDIKKGGYAIVDQTSGSANLAVQTSFVTDNGASLVTYTLPAAASAKQGDVFQVTGGSSGGWTIVQNTNQTIHVGTQSTTTTTGSLSSNGRYASITLQCINATGLDFVAVSSVGNFTVV